MTTFFASATLIAPVAMKADDHHDKKYYDRDARDYHTWDAQEDRAYRVYLGEQHQSYRAFNKTKAKDQQDYFKWRHNHSNDSLFKLEVK